MKRIINGFEVDCASERVFAERWLQVQLPSGDWIARFKVRSFGPGFATDNQRSVK
jgi:hypothetical protein